MKWRTVVRLLAGMAVLHGTVVLVASCQKRSESPAATSTPAGPSGTPRDSLALSPGQTAFLTHCAMCHGTWGAGDGPMAQQLMKNANVKPADLTNRERLQKLGRQEIIRVIDMGGTHLGRSNLMPPWHGKLDHQTIEQIADFVLTLPDLSPTTPPALLESFLAAPPGSAPDGRTLFVFYCAMCHGPEGRGDGQLADSLAVRNGIRPRNLTDSTYLATRTDQELQVTVALGGGHVHKSAYMPAWSVTLTPTQIKDLISYVRAISHTQPH